MFQMSLFVPWCLCSMMSLFHDVSLPWCLCSTMPLLHDASVLCMQVPPHWTNLFILCPEGSPGSALRRGQRSEAGTSRVRLEACVLKVVGMLTLLNSILKLEGIVTDVARYIWHETFISWCHFLQCPLEIGSASAERVGLGEVGGTPKGCRQHGCLWAQP